MPCMTLAPPPRRHTNNPMVKKTASENPENIEHEHESGSQRNVAPSWTCHGAPVCYLGTTMSTTETFVGLSDGEVVRTDALCRIKPDQKWRADFLQCIQGTPSRQPWKPYDSYIVNPSQNITCTFMTVREHFLMLMSPLVEHEQHI